MQKSLSKGFLFGMGFFAIAGAVFLIIAVMNIMGALRASREAEQYQSARECLGSNTSAGQSSPCRQERVVVLDKSQHILPTRHSLWHIYTLDLRRTDGSAVSESHVQQGLWQSLAVGAPVSATVWEGKIIGLAANGYTSDTSDDPSVASLLGVMAFVFWGLGAIFCVVMIRLLKTVGTS